MIEKTQELVVLFDIYGCLLTSKQQEIMNYYYEEDFSLSEIAETLEISRAAVLDHLKRSSKILEDYEKKLHLVEKYDTRSKLYDKIKEEANAQIVELVENLEQIENM